MDIVVFKLDSLGTLCHVQNFGAFVKSSISRVSNFNVQSFRVDVEQDL